MEHNSIVAIRAGHTGDVFHRDYGDFICTVHCPHVCVCECLLRTLIEFTPQAAFRAARMCRLLNHFKHTGAVKTHTNYNIPVYQLAPFSF